MNAARANVPIPDRIRMSGLRRLKLALVLVIGCFVAAALYITTLVNERQEALKEVARYNASWIASQAVGEFMRLENRLAGRTATRTRSNYGSTSSRRGSVSSRRARSASLSRATRNGSPW